MKKIICLLMALAILLGTFGCTKEPENQENNQSEKNYEIVGEKVTFEDHGYLDEYETICIDISDEIEEDDYYLLMGVYEGEDYTYYYLPDPEALQNGQISFETLHHSLFGAAKVDKSVLIDEWTKRAAVNIVTQNDANGKVESSLGDVVNSVLTNLNLDSGSYGGKVLEYVLSQDTEGEILQAAIDGDQTKLQQKTACLIADAIFDEGLFSGGDVIDIVSAYTNEENWAEGAVALSKEIQKKVFPEIDAVSKFADLVDKTFDLWAENTMDEVYRTQYTKMSVNSSAFVPWQGRGREAIIFFSV